MRSGSNPFFYVAGGALLGASLGWFGSWALGSAWARSVDEQLASQQYRRERTWSELRREGMTASERDSQVLPKARAQISELRTKAPSHKIPIEAAVCFAAREMIDDDLREAMGSGREFGAALSTWQAERRAVNQFCAYGMTIGAEG